MSNGSKKEKDAQPTNINDENLFLRTLLPPRRRNPESRTAEEAFEGQGEGGRPLLTMNSRPSREGVEPMPPLLIQPKDHSRNTYHCACGRAGMSKIGAIIHGQALPTWVGPCILEKRCLSAPQGTKSGICPTFFRKKKTLRDNTRACPCIV